MGNFLLPFHQNNSKHKVKKLHDEMVFSYSVGAAKQLTGKFKDL